MVHPMTNRFAVVSRVVLLRAALCLVAGSVAAMADAHFIYIIPPESGQTQVQVAFGEGPAPADSNDLLNYLDGVQLTSTSTEEALPLSTGEGALTASGNDAAVFTASKTVGVMSRGNETFRLEYYAKGGPNLDQWSWRDAPDLQLNVTPTSFDERTAAFKVKFAGEPVVGAEVSYEFAVDTESAISGETTTDEKGVFTLKDVPAGLASLRVRYVVSEPGEFDGKPYESVRHYATLTARIPSEPTMTRELVTLQSTDLPDLPESLTSFGATRLGRSIYVYGGHTSGAHSYSMEEQAKTLWKLDLDDPAAGWTTLAEADPIQGNAVVAANGKVWLLGGFTAMNHDGEDQDLHSQATVRIFDPSTGELTDGPALPEARSSFDAIAAGDVIFAAGGWAMQGEEETVWHQTSWKLDTNDLEAGWQPLAGQPFQRRALALAPLNGKVYVIGGMSESAGPTTQVDIYDPQSDAWFRGPNLHGKPMNGFGCAAFVANDRLFVTAYDGSVQLLSKDGTAWELVGQMEQRRFFHRLVPVADNRVLILGGADMEVGRFSDVDELKIFPQLLSPAS